MIQHDLVPCFSLYLQLQISYRLFSNRHLVLLLFFEGIEVILSLLQVVMISTQLLILCFEACQFLGHLSVNLFHLLSLSVEFLHLMRDVINPFRQFTDCKLILSFLISSVQLLAATIVLSLDYMAITLVKDLLSDTQLTCKCHHFQVRIFRLFQ